MCSDNRLPKAYNGYAGEWEDITRNEQTWTKCLSILASCSMELPLHLGPQYRFVLHLALHKAESSTVAKGRESYFLECWEIVSSPFGEMVVDKGNAENTESMQRGSLELDLNGKTQEEWCVEQNSCELQRANTELESWRSLERAYQNSENVKYSIRYYEEVTTQFIQWFKAHGKDVPVIDMLVAPPRNKGYKRRTRIIHEELYPKIIDDLCEAYDGGSISSKVAFELVSKGSKERYGEHFTPGQLRGIFSRKHGRFTR